MTSNKDLQTAQAQHYRQFQQLTFTLQCRGLLTGRELADIYGELQDYDNQAAYELGLKHGKEQHNA